MIEASSPPRDRLPPHPTGVGAGLLTIAGLAAAFGVAACCALPLLLISFGLGTALLGGIASITEPNRTLFLAVAALALAGGAILLWRQQRQAKACGSGAFAHRRQCGC